ncbi:hypothetical protein [Brevundimonas naejangsanensis]|nr:hypothetical protein [Brevundimonas naejangsanensis]
MGAALVIGLLLTFAAWRIFNSDVDYCLDSGGRWGESGCAYAEPSE